MMDKTDSLSHRFIKTTEVEGKQDAVMNSEAFRTDLGQTVTGTIHLQEGQGMDKNIEVGQGMIQIIEGITETI